MILTLLNLMLSKSRDFCAPKAWKKCKKVDLGGKKEDFKHFFFFVSIFASNVEYWKWLKIFSCPELVAYKKRVSFWNIFFLTDSWLEGFNSMSGSTFAQNLLKWKAEKKCMCKKYLQHNILVSFLSQSNWSS